jgi:acetoacetyl-CoA synthetase
MGIIASVPPLPDKVPFPPLLSTPSFSPSHLPPQIIVAGAIRERPSWFPGTRLNYAENLLWRDDDGIAITAAYEHDLHPTSADRAQFSGVKQYTFHALREMVRVMAAGMKRAGVRVGDRVAGKYCRIAYPFMAGMILTQKTWVSLGDIASSHHHKLRC